MLNDGPAENSRAQRAKRITLLRQLVDEAPRHKNVADVLYRLAQATEEQLREDHNPDFAKLLDLLDRAWSSGKKPVTSIAGYRYVWLAYYAKQWARALEGALRLLEDPEFAADADFSSGILFLASSSLRQLGGLARANLAASRPAALAIMAFDVAEDSLSRHDFLEAMRAWELIAERAPNSLQAPAALAALVSGHSSLGNHDKARDYQTRLTKYGLDSDWAKALRAGRSPAGDPDETKIRSMLSYTVQPQTRPKTEAELRKDSEAGLIALVQACYCEKELSGMKLKVNALPRGDAPADIRVVGPDGVGSVKVLVDCMQSEGSHFFEGLERSLSASVELQWEESRRR